jgi:hypothetical protein
MNVACFAIALFALLQARAIFETDIWPREGRPVFEASSSELPLREMPSRTSRIKKIKVTPGERLSYDDARYQTILPGRIEVLSSAIIEGRLIGSVTKLPRDKYYSDTFSKVKIRVVRGKKGEYLQDRAEGSCFVRIDDKIVDASPCPDVGSFKVVLEPKTEGWIHVVSGDSTGWLLISEASAKLVAREF